MKQELKKKWLNSEVIKLRGLSPDEQINLIFQVVEKHQFMKVKEDNHIFVIDATSAGMFKSVWEAISEKNKQMTKHFIAKYGLNNVLFKFINLYSKSTIK